MSDERLRRNGTLSTDRGSVAALFSQARRFYEAGDEKRWGRDNMPDMEGVVDYWLSCAKMEPDEVVLELGCGKGAFRHLADRFAYVPVDIAFEALRRYLRPRRAVQADVENLPFASESVAFVLSVATLEHIPSPENALKEIQRILKPGGMAFLAPAWFCRPWAAKGLPLRSYSELGLVDKIRKALIPLRNNLVWRGAFVLPRRLFREIQFHQSSRPWKFWCKRLEPNLTEYVYTDCDAFSSLDPHEAALLFKYWGFKVLSAPSFFRRIFLRNVPLVVQKPGRST